MAEVYGVTPRDRVDEGYDDSYEYEPRAAAQTNYDENYVVVAAVGTFVEAGDVEYGAGTEATGTSEEPMSMKHAVEVLDKNLYSWATATDPVGRLAVSQSTLMAIEANVDGHYTQEQSDAASVILRTPGLLEGLDTENGTTPTDGWITTNGVSVVKTTLALDPGPDATDGTMSMAEAVDMLDDNIASWATTFDINGNRAMSKSALQDVAANLYGRFTPKQSQAASVILNTPGLFDGLDTENGTTAADGYISTNGVAVVQSKLNGTGAGDRAGGTGANTPPMTEEYAVDVLDHYLPAWSDSETSDGVLTISESKLTDIASDENNLLYSRDEVAAARTILNSDKLKNDLDTINGELPADGYISQDGIDAVQGNSTSEVGVPTVPLMTHEEAVNVLGDNLHVWADYESADGAPAVSIPKLYEIAANVDNRYTADEVTAASTILSNPQLLNDLDNNTDSIISQDEVNAVQGNPSGGVGETEVPTMTDELAVEVMEEFMPKWADQRTFDDSLIVSKDTLMNIAADTDNNFYTPIEVAAAQYLLDPNNAQLLYELDSADGDFYPDDLISENGIDAVQGDDGDGTATAPMTEDEALAVLDTKLEEWFTGSFTNTSGDEVGKITVSDLYNIANGNGDGYTAEEITAAQTLVANEDLMIALDTGNGETKVTDNNISRKNLDAVLADRQTTAGSGDPGEGSADTTEEISAVNTLYENFGEWDFDEDGAITIDTLNTIVANADETFSEDDVTAAQYLLDNSDVFAKLDSATRTDGSTDGIIAFKDVAAVLGVEPINVMNENFDNWSSNGEFLTKADLQSVIDNEDSSREEVFAAHDILHSDKFDEIDVAQGGDQDGIVSRSDIIVHAQNQEIELDAATGENIPAENNPGEKNNPAENNPAENNPGEDSPSISAEEEFAVNTLYENFGEWDFDEDGAITIDTLNTIVANADETFSEDDVTAAQYLLDNSDVFAKLDSATRTDGSTDGIIAFKDVAAVLGVDPPSVMIENFDNWSSNGENITKADLQSVIDNEDSSREEVFAAHDILHSDKFDEIDVAQGGDQDGIVSRFDITKYIRNENNMTEEASALETMYGNYDKWDIEGDGGITNDTLDTIVANEDGIFNEEDRTAAQFLIDNPVVFDDLDSATRTDGSLDGIVAFKDLATFMGVEPIDVLSDNFDQWSSDDSNVVTRDDLQNVIDSEDSTYEEVFAAHTLLTSGEFDKLDIAGGFGDGMDGKVSREDISAYNNIAKVDPIDVLSDNFDQWSSYDSNVVTRDDLQNVIDSEDSTYEEVFAAHALLTSGEFDKLDTAGGFGDMDGKVSREDISAYNYKDEVIFLEETTVEVAATTMYENFVQWDIDGSGAISRDELDTIAKNEDGVFSDEDVAAAKFFIDNREYFDKADRAIHQGGIQGESVDRMISFENISKFMGIDATKVLEENLEGWSSDGYFVTSADLQNVIADSSSTNEAVLAATQLLDTPLFSEGEAQVSRPSIQAYKVHQDDVVNVLEANFTKWDVDNDGLTLDDVDLVINDESGTYSTEEKDAAMFLKENTVLFDALDAGQFDGLDGVIIMDDIINYQSQSKPSV